jgi:Flp pilus assembly protein TadG
MRAVSRRRLPSRLRSRGQALVELSLAAVVLVTLVVGSAQVALLYYDQMSVSTGAREAAVIAAENPANTGLFTAPNSPTSPGSHTCSGTGDAILACAAAFNSTHGGTFGGLITTSNLSVSLAGAKYTGSSPVVCTGFASPSTSDGTVTVTVTYNAPIFVPFVGAVLATSGQTYRTMTSTVTVRVEPCDVTKGN